MIEVNGPVLIVNHIEQCKNLGTQPDIQFIKEVSEVTIEYMGQINVPAAAPWHEVVSDWIEDNPEHSGVWGS